MASTLGSKDSCVGNVKEESQPEAAGTGSRVRRESQEDARADHALTSRRVNGAGDDPRAPSKPRGGSVALTADQPSRENGHRAKREHGGGAEPLGGGASTVERNGNVDHADVAVIGGVVDAGGGRWQWFNPKKRSGASRDQTATGDQQDAPSHGKFHSLASARPSDHSLQHDAGGSDGLDLGILDARKRKDLRASLSISSDESEQSATASWLSAASSLRRSAGNRRRPRAKSKKGGSQCSTGFESAGGGSTDSAAFIEAHMPASLPARRRPSASNGCAGDDETPGGNESIQISTVEVRSTNGKKAVPSSVDTAAAVGTHEQKRSLNGQMPKKLSDEGNKGQPNAVKSRSQDTVTAPPPPGPKPKKAEGAKAENGKAPRQPVGNIHRAAGEVTVKDIESMIPKPAVRPSAKDRGVSAKIARHTADSASAPAPPKPSAPAEAPFRSGEQTGKEPQRPGSPTKHPSVNGTKQLRPEHGTVERPHSGEKPPAWSRAQGRKWAREGSEATAGGMKEGTRGQGSKGHSSKGEQVDRTNRTGAEISPRQEVEFSRMRLVPPDEEKLPQVSPVRTPQAVPNGAETRAKGGQGPQGIDRRTRHLIARASKVPDREKTASTQANGGHSILAGKSTHPKPQVEASTRATSVGNNANGTWGGLHGDQASSFFRAGNHPGMSGVSHAGATSGCPSTPGSPTGSAAEPSARERNGRGGKTSMYTYKHDARRGDPSDGASSWILADRSFSEAEGQDYRKSARSRDTAAMSAPASPSEARSARPRAPGGATPGPGRDVEHYHDYYGRGGSSSYGAVPPSATSESGVSYWTDGATERSRSSILTGTDSQASSRHTTEGEPAGGTWSSAKNEDEDHALRSLEYFPPPSPCGEDSDLGTMDDQLAAARPAVASGATASKTKAAAEPAEDIDPGGQRKEGAGWSQAEPSRHPDNREAGADEQDSVRYPPPSPSTPAAGLFLTAAVSGHHLPSRPGERGSGAPRQERWEEDDPETRKGITDAGGDSGGPKDHEDENNGGANRRNSLDEDDIGMSELPRLVYGLKRPVKKPAARRIRRGGSIPNEVLTKAAGSTQLSKKGSSLYLEGSGNRAAEGIGGVESCGGAVEVSDSTWCTPDRGTTENQSEQAEKPPAPAKGWRLPSVRRARDGAKDKVVLERKASNASSHKSHGSGRFGGIRRLSPAGFANTPDRHVFEDDSQQRRNERLKTSERRHRRKQSRESSKGRSKDDQPSKVARGERQEDSEQARNEADGQGGQKRGSGEGQAHEPNGNKAKADSGNPAFQSGAPRPPGKRPPLVVPPLPRVLNRPYPFDNRGQNGYAKAHYKGNNGTQASRAMDEEGGNATASGSRSEEKTSNMRPSKPKLIVSASSPIDHPQPPPVVSMERSKPRNGKGTTPGFAAAPRRLNPRRFSRGHGTAISDAGSAFSWHVRNNTEGSQGDSTGGDSDYLSLEGIVIPKHFRDGTFGGSGTGEGLSHTRNASSSGCRNSGNGACSPSSPPRRGFSRSPRDERKSHSHKSAGRRSARDTGGSASGSTRSVSLPSFFFTTSWKSDWGRRDDAAPRGRKGRRGGKGVARVCAVLSASWIRRGGNKSRQRESEFHEELQRPTGDSNGNAPGDDGRSRSLRRVREDEGIRLAAPDVNRNGGRVDSDRNDADRRHDNIPEEARDARRLKAATKSANEKGRGKSSRDRKSSASSMTTTAAPVDGGREFEVWRDMEDSGTREDFLVQEGSLCWLNPMGYEKSPIPPGGSLLGTPAGAPSSGEDKSFGRDYEPDSDEDDRRRMDALLMRSQVHSHQRSIAVVGREEQKGLPP